MLLLIGRWQVRKCYDMMEDYYSPRSAASDCLSTLCKVPRAPPPPPLFPYPSSVLLCVGSMHIHVFV